MWYVPFREEAKDGTGHPDSWDFAKDVCDSDAWSVLFAGVASQVLLPLPILLADTATDPADRRSRHDVLLLLLVPAVHLEWLSVELVAGAQRAAQCRPVLVLCKEGSREITLPLQEAEGAKA